MDGSGETVMDLAVRNFSLNESSNITAGFGGPPRHYRDQQAVYYFIHAYVLPIIVFSGLMGNSLSSYAFLEKGLRNISSSVYVQAVLISDTGVLISLLFVWLEVLGYRFNHMPNLCQFLVYWGYICTFLSVWLVVCITVENYVTICHPARIRSMCTVRRATMVTTSLAFFAMVAYLVSFFTTTVQVYKVGGRNIPMCLPSPELRDIASMVAYIDTFITLLIPLILITLMLVAISLAICRSIQNKRKRSALKSSKSKMKMSTIPQVRVAKMLGVLSATFLLLNAPSHITRLYLSFRPSASSSVTFREAFVQLALQFLYYSNFSVKFLLFFICSRNFRKSFSRYCKPACLTTSEKYSTVNCETTEIDNIPNGVEIKDRKSEED
ncbi:neuropeptides capa receptor-like [Mizuhopecten yessoensis]|uniref:Neuropeptides capa receptor n=1 Tax=Mizuhopecten yessoensis TaxID=6573 RepID=A0A210QLR9_MIZYE|nr:neuropeptides capa receptor-like [Mizuhopecten yessoensis]OWF49676.1 Neuropeptides capa receptor [Mizuhopecten yessoensis]